MWKREYWKIITENWLKKNEKLLENLNNLSNKVKDKEIEIINSYSAFDSTINSSVSELSKNIKTKVKKLITN